PPATTARGRSARTRTAGYRPAASPGSASARSITPTRGAPAPARRRHARLAAPDRIHEARPMHHLYLSIAILAEVAATTALKAADGFTRLAPSIAVVIGYALAFYLLSLALRTMAVGVVYAIWSGVGIVLISIVGALLYRQHLDLPAVVGIGLIVAGVLVLNLASRTVTY